MTTAGTSTTRGVAILTGATGIFGKHIAAGLVEAGYATVCIGRDESKGAALLSYLRNRFGPNAPDVSFHCVDCSSYHSIQAFAKQWAASKGTTAVDILVNNAAVTPPTRSVTAEGIEVQWACNVLGYHWFVQTMFSAMQRARAPRIVNVASFYAGGLKLEDPEFTTRRYDVDKAYQASKQADRMLAREWAERLGPNFTVVSCHPGVATSGVSLGLGYDMDRTEEAAAKGSQTPLHCALSSDIATGKYYKDNKEERCPYSENETERVRLFELMEQYTAKAAAATMSSS